MFTAGMTTAPVDVPIIDDNTSENNESFDIVIDQLSLPNRVSAGNPDQVTVTIVDDDGMQTTRFDAKIFIEYAKFYVFVHIII